MRDELIPQESQTLRLRFLQAGRGGVPIFWDVVVQKRRFACSKYIPLVQKHQKKWRRRGTVCNDLTCSAISQIWKQWLLASVFTSSCDYSHVLFVFSYLFGSWHCVLMKKRRFLNPMKSKGGCRTGRVCSDLTCSAISEIENSDVLPAFSHLFMITVT